MSDSQARAQRRRVVYLEKQKEEGERVMAQLKIRQAEELFAQEHRRSLRSDLKLNLGDKLRAAGLVK